MPIINGPYHDPEDDERPRGRKAPKELIRLKRQFTYEKQLSVFREVFGRDPACDSELDEFADEYIIELYNSGHDEV